MKKALVTGILSLAAAVCVQAQGRIIFYNYASGKTINYGSGSGGTLGQPVSQSTPFTVGLYWALTSSFSAATINAAMVGDGGYGLIPSLTLQGVTAPLGNVGGDYPGQFGNLAQLASFGGVTPANVTLVIVAYNGANYASSTIRGHSAAFELNATVSPTPASYISDGAWSSFAVTAVPEPSTFALAGLGLASLLIFRRRK